MLLAWAAVLLVLAGPASGEFMQRPRWLKFSGCLALHDPGRTLPEVWDSGIPDLIFAAALAFPRGRLPGI
jgi:hypothetical protein